MTRLSVVGRSCRLPGANSVAEFWDLLVDGRCSVTAVPEERFLQSWYSNPRRGEAGKAYTFAAGVLDDVWGFDPAVFSITPREARQMDPQQRILLQLVWEAFEDAGVAPSDVSGKRIGVYIGASTMDYSHRQFFDPAGTDSYMMTGNTLSLISNRISYIFDLQGPSLTLDTACSSSLVALDYAAQDLRSGRVDTAIVGGINALLSPFNYMGFCAASMLSPDGLCRPFDHRGNGYVRSEGGVVMLLQRADGDGIASRKNYGEVIASGMNSDGRTSGVALPSSEQQGQLLHRLYEEHGIDPNRLAFVEAHGTGTMVGDPAEAGALGRMLGVHRNEPLPIGSAKSNVGHLEPASGIVGLLKSQLALENGYLPRSLHVEKLNPNIPFDELNLHVAVEPIELANNPDKNLAGINNFGFGGTNVHVILAAPEQRACDASEEMASKSPVNIEVARSDRPSEDLLLISAHCRDALRTLATSYSALLSNMDASDASARRDVIAAAAHRRDKLPYRVAVTGRTTPELAERLTTFAHDDVAAHIVDRRAVARDAKTALVFSGNGAQWDGMGRVAFETSASFRRHFNAVDEHYKALTGTSLEDLLFADDLAAQLVRTEIAQPLLFAVQVALARALQDQGLIIGATLGHSVGEVAAAHIAGALDLKKAVAVIRARSQHQELAAGMGLMAAVQAGAAEVEALLEGSGLSSVEVAAHNSPRSVTVSGAADEVRAFAELAARNKTAVRVLDINYPFHSARLDIVQAPLMETLGELSADPTTLSMYSTVTGDLIDGAELNADYWWRNVRQPVRFDAAVASCADAGYQVFIEVGPKSILRKYISDSTANTDLETQVITTLESSDTSDRPPVRAALARAIVAGATYDSDAVFGQDTGGPFDLPHYAWQNKEYLFSRSSEALNTFSDNSAHHDLLGIELRSGENVWDSHIDTGLVPFLADHKIGSKSIMPGTGFVEMALSAASSNLNTQHVELRDMDFVQALELDSESCQSVRTRLDRESSTIEISSRARLTSDERQTHARTRFASIPSEDIAVAEAPEIQVSDTAAPIGSIYRLAEKFGLNYGPMFQRVTSCREIGDDIIELELSRLAPEAEQKGVTSRFIIHPVDFDCCFHGINVVFERLVFGENKLAYVPVHLGRLRVFAPGQRIRSARIRLDSYNNRAACARFEMFAADGTLVAVADNVRFRASNLVHRLGLSQACYHWSHVTRPLPGRSGQSPAPAVADLVAALGQSFGANADEAATFEENRLLLEMAARRAAYDVVRSIADADGSIDLAPELLSGSDCGSDNDNINAEPPQLPRWRYQSRDCAAALANLLSLLASSDLAHSRETNAHWQLVPPEDCPLPQLDEIVAAVLQDDSAWSAECVLLLRAVDHLKQWLAAAPETEADDAATEDEAETPPVGEAFSTSALEHFYAASPSARTQIAHVVGALSEAISAWPEGKPIRLLQLGVATGGLTRALIAMLRSRDIDADRVRLVVADTDASWIARLANLHLRTPGFDAVHVTADLEALAPFGGFDIVVSANGLHQLHNSGVLLANLREHMAPGSLAIMAESEPSAYQDVIFAGTNGWFDTAVIDGVAHGRLRDRDHWLTTLEAAGFASAEGSRTSASPGSSFILAQRVAADAEEDVTPLEAEPRHALLFGASAQAADVVSGLHGALTEANVQVTVSARSIAAMLKSTVADKGEAVAGASDGLQQTNDDLVDLFSAAGDATPDIVYVSPVSAGESQTELLRQTAELTALFNSIGERKARVWIIAEGGARAVVDLGPASPVQAGLWAFGRTALNEHAHLDVRLVDISGDLSLNGAQSTLVDLLREPGSDAEIILTKTAQHALQVRRGPPAATPQPADIETSREPATVLELGQSGDLETLNWIARGRRVPAPGEVEIEVAATGLNFRDVMWALGLLPEEALEDGFAGPTVGFECSGTVVRVGAGVTELNVGDPVIAMAPACFASHVTVTTDAVARLPDTVALDHAASIPVAFLTAYYALDTLAGLREDEWVLIHGAAGGVGLAAVQIAKRAGARIIATAGTDEKRAILTALGADHVLNTRSLEFIDDVKALTDGKGVDVVLNSLAGEAMERSIDLLKPFGRFLELGKRDFYANTKVGLRPFRRNVSYFGIDADQLLTYRPDVVRRVFAQIIDGFADGTFAPLPHRVFDADTVVDAFRLMQKSGHIGKILVKAPSETAGAAFTNREFKANSEGTHILVGGTGGFGLEMVRWLADRGARHVLVTSRSGGGDEIALLQAELAQRNVSLRVARCDATDADALDKVLKAERRDRPIVGIAHTAMVLDDGLMKNLTPERIERVLAPKVVGADNLDRLTREDDLDYFILFSSAAALFGNPGQASYTAANGYLDGLAQKRRAEGLKATAVAWGAISDVGVLAREKDTAESLARHTGGVEFKARDGLNLLARLLVRDDCDAACANISLATMNWSMADEMLSIMKTPAFELIRREAAAGGSDRGEQVDIRAAIEGLDDDAARGVLAEFLAREVAAIFRMPVEDISLKRSLADIGMDSLMGLELRMAAQRGLGIDIPMVSISDGTTINDIASRVLTRLRGGEDDDLAAGARNAMLDKHVSEDVDQADLQRLEKQVEEREAGLKKVI